jgi:hypothetical protein
MIRRAMQYGIQTVQPGEQEDFCEISATSEDQAIDAIRRDVEIAKRLPRNQRPIGMYLTFSRAADGCTGYLNPPSGDASPSAESWL